MGYFFQSALLRLSKHLMLLINIIVGFCSLISIILGVYLFGFKVEAFYVDKVIHFFRIILILFLVLHILRMLVQWFGTRERTEKHMRWGTLSLLIINIIVQSYFASKVGNAILVGSLMVISLVNISQGAIRFMTHIVNPMGIFVFSFFLIIVIGAVLLNLPNSTYQEGNLSIVDAIFVSTSATCVTGLCPVDFTATFTLYGQLVVLALIQIGGLGVVTITSFFALSLMGALPFSSSMMIKDLISEDKTKSISSLVVKIVSTTFAIEACGALLIFISMGDGPIINFWEKFYFSVFHSISAFCNAGFSNYPGSLGDSSLVPNNSLYYIVSSLIILGGIGFPVYTNLFKIISMRFRQLFRRLKKMRVKRYVHSWDINSVIVLEMTLALLVLATAYFLVFEWNGMLASLPVESKIAQAFFNAVLPRTAGFTSQDISSLNGVTFLVILLLMWIGGAPQSTAGGIKVTTVWVMIKNAYSQIRGRDAVEIRNRTVSSISVKRAFAGVFLTTFTIIVAFTALLCTEQGIAPHKLLFETVSAIGTVGSSMNVTTELSTAGKYIISGVMFAGRIGIITIISAFFHKKKTINYRYPGGDILIN